MLKFTHVDFCRGFTFHCPIYPEHFDKLSVNVVEGQFDFYFKLDLPKKQVEREIILRDYLGRIVKAKVLNSSFNIG